VLVSDDNFDDDGYNYYDDPPTYAEETNDTLADKTSTTEKISTTHKTLKVGATFEKSAASNSIGETSTNIKNTYKPSSLNTQQQSTEKSSALSVPNKGYKTPNRRLATKPMDLVCKGILLTKYSKHPISGQFRLSIGLF
jgi:hypothetical protein